MARKLTVNDVRALCCTDVFGAESTEDIEPYVGIVGQDRALSAVCFGLGIRDSGFNIFAVGEPGTGRSTAISEYLAQIAGERPVPPDWVYVHNFKDPYQPKALRLNAGQGAQFAQDISSLVDTARREIPRVFESDEYHEQREQTLSSFNQKRQQLAGSMNDRALKQGFAIQSTSVGPALTPLVRGRPMNEQELATLAGDTRQRIAREREALESELMDTLRDIRTVEREGVNAVDRLDRKTVLYVSGHLFDALRTKYGAHPDVIQYLDHMQEDMVQNSPLFRGQQSSEPDKAQQTQAPPWTKEMAYRKYSVNVIVDNSSLTGAPVATEPNATYSNLFGRIEKESQMGVLVTDFTLVRPGALHRANGGFIVIAVEELLRNPVAYDGLKRAIRGRELVIEEAGERMGLMVTKTLRPQAIALDVKVVLIGTDAVYRHLYRMDPEFSELFKVKAEFDTVMERCPKNMRTYAALMRRLCLKEGLRHLHGGALARLIEHSSRLAGDQKKLSTRFADVADIIREGSHYAAQQDSKLVMHEHIEQAIDARVHRFSLTQSRFEEMVERGVLMIETAGSAIGEVNGLSVLGQGDITFGRPNKISITVGPGRDGIIDIEREVNLSGSIHSKGVLILGGFLTQRYAKEIPLSLNAQIVFEQSYGPIDGDSASSAELYALLSALSGLPVRRSFAVTGSVNQAGQVQAIGGVNEKVEGFFEVCKLKGLDGTQGVLIPSSNVENLMLKDEVVEAINQGMFSVYAITTIDEGIEALTGVPAGVMQPNGSYPEGTVNHLVSQRLSKFAESVRLYAR